MIIATRDELIIDDVLTYHQKAIPLLLMIVGSVVLSFHHMSKVSAPASFAIEKKGLNVIPTHQAVIDGMLSLKNDKIAQSIPNLSREIFILGRNSRPDAQALDSQVLLALRCSQEKVLVANGEQVYLALEEGLEGSWRFSNEPTSLSFCPFILDRNSVLLDVSMHIAPSENQIAVDEKMQFIIKDREATVDAKAEKSQSMSLCIKPLKEAVYLGRDLFLENYGAKNTNCNKLEVTYLDQRESYFLSKDDYLLWNGSSWNAIDIEESDANKPLAQVTNISARSMDLTIWDSSGFHPVRIKLTAPPSIKPNYQLEELFFQTKMRTAKQISCRLGNKRMLIKSGDWLLKEEDTWRHLRKLDEIDDFIAGKLKGELLIFDGLSKSEGQWILTAHLFDSMRTAMQEFQFPIAADKHTDDHIKRR